VRWAEWFMVAVLATTGISIRVAGWVAKANRVIDRAKADVKRGDGW
jgi:hypothetical protein